MPIPVPIPAGPLLVTDQDVQRAEAILKALAQLMGYGSTGASPTTPPSLIPSGTNPPIDPATGKPKVVPFLLDTAEKQLLYRQLAIAVAKNRLRERG
jgi:hypothetical protein